MQYGSIVHGAEMIILLYVAMASYAKFTADGAGASGNNERVLPKLCLDSALKVDQRILRSEWEASWPYLIFGI